MLCKWGVVSKITTIEAIGKLAVVDKKIARERILQMYVKWDHRQGLIRMIGVFLDIHS